MTVEIGVEELKPGDVIYHPFSGVRARILKTRPSKNPRKIHVEYDPKDRPQGTLGMHVPRDWTVTKIVE